MVSHFLQGAVMTSNVSIDELSVSLAQATAQEVVRTALQHFHKQCAISFSGAEDVLVIEYAKQTGLPFSVFTLDTGRLHPETYRFFDAVEKHYGLRIDYCCPDAQMLQQLVRTKGLFSFYNDGHSECCGIRKVEPLKRQLAGLRAWLTGQRRDQSPTRTSVPVVQKDPAFRGLGEGDLVKFNPLAAVSREEVWLAIRALGLPYNALHDRGFVSIGCEPCTKAILPSQHEREGRWWWEAATAKECGLHRPQHLRTP